MKKVLILVCAVLMFVLASCNANIEVEQDGETVDVGVEVSGKTTITPAEDVVDVEEVVLHAYTMGENYTFAGDISSKGYTVLLPTTGGWVVADIEGNIVYDEYRKYKSWGWDVSIVDNIVIFAESGEKTLFINIEDGTIFEAPESAEYSTISEGKFFIKETVETLAGAEHYVTYYDTSFNKLFTIEAVDASIYKHDHAFILEEDDKLWIIDKNGNKIDWVFDIIKDEYYFSSLYNWYKNPVIEYIEGVYVSGIDFSFQDYDRGMVTESVTVKYAYRTSPDSEIKFDNQYIQNAILWSDGWLGWFDSELGSKFIANQEVVTINAYDTSLILQFNASDFIYVKDIPEFSSAAEWHIGKHSENAICVVLESINGVAFSAIIDADGNVLCQPTKDIVFFNGGSYNHYSGLDERCYFSEGLCPAFSVEKSAWGYIDKSGNWIIEPLYQYISPFNNGYATVVLSEFEPGDYYHLIIDKNGDNAWGNPK